MGARPEAISTTPETIPQDADSATDAKRCPRAGSPLTVVRMAKYELKSTKTGDLVAEGDFDSAKDAWTWGVAEANKHGIHAYQVADEHGENWMKCGGVTAAE